jgi:hypothetical protein
MGLSAVLGQLRVVLGGDNSGLDKSLKDSQSKVSSFANAAQIGLAAVGTAAIAAGAALTTMVQHAIDNADNLNKMSQSTGMTVQELSKLSYAAELSDVSAESLGKTIGKLSKAMVSAATDGGGAAATAFNAIGVSVKNTDGTLRTSSEVLSDVAEKFSGYTDSAQKTKLAIELFGKSGASLIPLLNQGKEGLADAAEEAEKFGLVIDKKTAVAAENFNDNLKRMDKIKQGLVMTMTAQLLPTFEHFSEQLLEAKQNSTLMSTAAEYLVAGFKVVVSEVSQAVLYFQRLGAEASALWKVLNAPWGEIGKAWDAYNAEGLKTQQMFTGLKSTIDAAFKPPAEAADWTSQLIGVKSMQKEVKLLGDEWGKTAAPITASGEATKNALQKFLEAQAKRTAGQTAEAETIGKSVGEQAKLKLAYEAEALALNNKIPLNAANNLLIAQAGDAAALAAMKIAGASATVAAMSPAQQFQAQMTQMQQLYDAGVISLETYGERQKQIAEAAGATWDIAGASMAGSFATIAGAFSKESSAMATAAKVFGVIQGTISMFTGAAKALELPFPANIAAVAAVLAKGASLVASIKGQSVPTGMMTGGSMMVRGSGGPDSVPVNMMVSPGEQIDVWRPDQGGGADPRRGGGGGNVINIPVPLISTRDTIAQLIGHINEALGDGHVLKVQPV